MLTADRAVLVVIDVQGKLAHLMHEKERLHENVRKLIQSAKILEIPIVATEQIPEKLGPTIPEVADLLGGAKPIWKNHFSCCGHKEFTQTIEATGCKQVLLTGIETHVCVYQTAIDLLGAGYQVHVVTDAVSSRAAENRALGIERMKAAGAIPTSTEMCVFEMLRVAEGDKFKQIVRIVR